MQRPMLATQSWLFVKTINKMAGLNTWHAEQDHADAGGPSAKNYCPKRDGDVHPGPAGTLVWTDPLPYSTIPAIVTHPQHQAPEPEMLDPFDLRLRLPCQCSQCQRTYPDFSLQPQLAQHHLSIGPVASPADSSQHSSMSAAWFPDVPFLPGMMLGNFHMPAATGQQKQKEMAKVSSNMSQPVVCDVSSGEAELVNPCEPDPFLVPMAAGPKQAHAGLAPDKDMEVLASTPEAACSTYESRGQTSNQATRAHPPNTVSGLSTPKSRKPCNCTRSQCLKLYCHCFAGGLTCRNCNCSNCHNNEEHDLQRSKAMKSCLGRDPVAFRPKDAHGRSGWTKGCNCKHSGCLKNYCKCYEVNIMCSSSCKCVGCKNYDGSSQTGLKEKTVGVKTSLPILVIPPSVIEALCERLLLCAEQAEQAIQSPARTEQMVLQEFGQSLFQIVKTMCK